MRRRGIWQALAVVLIVGLDQLTKALVRGSFALGEKREFLGNILSLQYVCNTGAAWSFLSDHTWVLTVISVVLSLVILVLLVRGAVRHPLAVWSLTAVLGGALGNLIDRVLFGAVTDMFRTEFMDFPVFNVADIFITLGGVAFVVFLVFFYRDGGKKDGEDHEDA